MEVREVSIERKLRNEVNKLGGLCFKFNSGVTGVPDRIIIYNGKTIFVETKKPKGGKISNKQKYWLNEISKRKVEAITIFTHEEIEVFIERLIGND